MFSCPPFNNKNKDLENWNSNIWRVRCREQVTCTKIAGQDEKVWSYQNQLSFSGKDSTAVFLSFTKKAHSSRHADQYPRIQKFLSEIRPSSSALSLPISWGPTPLPVCRPLLLAPRFISPFVFCHFWRRKTFTSCPAIFVHRRNDESTIFFDQWKLSKQPSYRSKPGFSFSVKNDNKFSS